jgi:hypothetical protein
MFTTTGSLCVKKIGNAVQVMYVVHIHCFSYSPDLKNNSSPTELPKRNSEHRDVFPGSQKYVV